ncbi:MAG: hypothetical protein JOZ38_08910, partial [Candidatus Eremiobacteraeota bacterium]|nr:hypothetical protein [Candidatus Eremiobacteraeota bacterium]
WFCDPGANAVAIMTSAGGVTSYPVPTPNASPTDIDGEDGIGHLWFTEPGASKVASITPSGTIVEYPIGAVPMAIVNGFTDIFVLTTQNNIVDVNSSTGTFTTLTPPNSAYGPVVGIDYDAGTGQLILLRSDGVTGAIQELYYN